MKKIILIFAFIVLSANFLNAAWGPFGSLVTTTGITNIGINQATANSTITLISDDPAVTQKGVVWSTSTDPTLSSYPGGNFTSQGAGAGAGPRTETFTSSLTGLTESTLYYVRTYATNSDGTFLSDQVTFTTIPTLPTWGLIMLGSITLLIGGFYVKKMFA